MLNISASHKEEKLCILHSLCAQSDSVPSAIWETSLELDQRDREVQQGSHLKQIVAVGPICQVRIWRIVYVDHCLGR